MHDVSIVKCDVYDEDIVYESVKLSFDNLGGAEKYIKKGMKVALKPNLLMPKSPDTCSVTHPYVTVAIGRVVREAGGIPYVAESPGGYYTVPILKILYRMCGLYDLCKKYDIGLNLDTSLSTISYETEKGRRRITVLKPLYEADLIINISKMKTHGMMVFTGCVKNMFGAIAGTEKAVYHFNAKDYDTFANELIDIYISLSPKLNFMDAIMAMEGKGPSAGTPKKVGLILASESGFAIDSTAHDIINVKKEQSFIMKNAESRKIDLSYNEIGERVRDVRIKDFDVPYVRRSVKFTKNKLISKLIDNMKSNLIVDEKKCIICRMCLNHCPADAIEIKNKVPVFNYKKCIRCYCCHELCPKHAIDIRDSVIVRILSGKKKI